MRLRYVTRADNAKDAFLERHLQTAETIMDSVTQRLVRLDGPNSRLFKDCRAALMEIRKMQFRYYPVQSHSLLRYHDCKIAPDGSIIRPIQKNNWRKYKRDQRRASHPKLDKYLGENNGANREA